MFVFVVFLVSGLWHGANWTFLAWGMIHAICFLPLLLIGRNRRYTDIVAQGRRIPSSREAFQMIATFIIIVFGWVFFRAPNVGSAVNWVGRMLIVDGGLNFSGTGITGLLPLAPWIITLIAVEWTNRAHLHGLQRLPSRNWQRFAIYWLILLVILLEQGSQQQFIYFQF